MTKKSNQKQKASTVSQQQAIQDEKVQSVNKQPTSLLNGPKEGKTKYIVSEGGSTSPRLIQPESLSPAVRSAQNIALLELLDQRPRSFLSSSSNNASGQWNVERRILSVQQERELSTNLAFLAGVSDCPNHVMGVCIAELPGIGGCQIMVAINKRLPPDGNEILRRVQKGFEQIFRRLRLLSAVKEAVFNDVVALCHERIMSRLRSRHSKVSYKDRKRNKRYIGHVLRDFMTVPWQDAAAENGTHMHMHSLKRYRSDLETLLDQLDRLEASDTARHEDVSRLVISVARVVDNVPLAGLLASIKNQDMAPQLRTWLLSCLSKIRRYREFASLLCHRARRIPILRAARVQTVGMAVQPKDMSFKSPETLNLWQSLSRFQYENEPVQMKTLPEWLRDLARSSARKYSDNVREILKEAKVHAEIQLLVHCENTHANEYRPRILASSKKACALCNTLIGIHGKYRVPKSHGRLYKGWRLPAAYQNGPLQDSLNMVLETQISETLERLIGLTKRPPIESHNESSIFSFHLSTSTLTEPPTSIISEPDKFKFLSVSEGHEGALTSNHMDVHSADNYQTGKDSIDGPGDEGQEGNTTDDYTPPLDDIGDRADGTGHHDNGETGGSIESINALHTVYARLKQRRKIIFNPGRAGVSYFRSSRMELFIDEASAAFSFELLSTAEAKAVLCDETRPVIDTAAISFEEEVRLPKCANGEAYFSSGEEIIRVCTRRM
ncbi:hypothetical protein J7T55_002134 [Diaporthe amygdali]|uniref:uncharacterized protein n=1 Tax=Phomopsis amygdali TaxID=1214568 RepID=UPI0022FE529E|nr:uncharacterized protein J7T55_002134 [Diaporthe amygdali]KAJ0108530.1 hypothetical protein J7T55_002134 [Diaporthe amygdali]